MREEEKIWQTRAQMDKCQNITDQMVSGAGRGGAGCWALAMAMAPAESEDDGACKSLVIEFDTFAHPPPLHCCSHCLLRAQLTILDSFDEKLSALESSMLPIHKGTQALTTAQKSTDNDTHMSR